MAASATEDVLADTLEQLNLNCRKRHNLYGPLCRVLGAGCWVLGAG